jgi:superfamily II DNA/RNA helicase
LKFTEFGLDQRLIDGIEAIGFETATPVQEQVIPPIMEGRDIIASAQTGTGKTAAFLLPIINKITSFHPSEHIQALVIVPTRELAVQIEQQMEGFSYFTPVSSIAIYGGGDGNSFTREKQALVEGTEVVICTPGRMIAHLNMGYVNTQHLKFLVLDEADRMLDMGFYDDINKIISFLPAKRQNLLFSATMPVKIRELARKILTEPAEINIAISRPPDKIKQEAYVIYESQKIPVVKHVLQQKELKSVLVFCSTKQAVKQLSRDLRRVNLPAAEIHSDLDQNEREQVLLNFRNHKTRILVATDILSRGIDIEDIDLVINYDVPHDGEDYVHRIGRTARAESDGAAITLINEKEQNRFARIERLIGIEVAKTPLPAEFGEAPAYNPSLSRPGNRRKNFRKGGGKGKFNHSRKPRPDNKSNGNNRPRE